MALSSRAAAGGGTASEACAGAAAGRTYIGRVLACENDLPCASGDAGRATELYLLSAE